MKKSQTRAGSIAPSGSKKNEHKLESATERCKEVKTEMKRKVGKEPEGGGQKSKEVGNESHLRIPCFKNKLQYQSDT